MNAGYALIAGFIGGALSAATLTAVAAVIYRTYRQQHP